MANRFPLIFNSGAGQIQELAASDNLDLTSSNLVNAGILFTSSGSATAPSMSIGSGTTYPPGLYSPGTDQLAVATNGTGRLFIDASGNVLINDSASVTSNVTGYVRIRQVNAASDTSIGIINAQNSDANATVKIQAGQYTRHGGEIVFGRENGGDWTNTNTADGYIAFSPVLNNTNTEALRITSTGALNFVGAGTAGSTQAVSFNGSAPVNSLVIDSSGRLGIGTSSPDTRLQVFSGTVNSNVLKLTGTVGGRGLVVSTFASTTDDDSVAFDAQSASGQLALRTGGNDRLRITQAGNVGIGTTSPTTKLDIYTGSATGTYIKVENTEGRLFAGVFGTGEGYLATETSDPLVLGTNGSEKARIDTSGRLLIGTVTENANGGILQLSSGITFPATAVAASDANTLDDYEEGAWTPSVGGTATYNAQSGRYIKIGKIVIVSGRLNINALGTGSTTTISGLPFTRVNTTAPPYDSGSVGLFSNLAISPVFLAIKVEPNATTLTFASLTTASSSMTNVPVLFGNSSLVDFTVTYEASA